MSTITQLTELYHKFCSAVSDGKEIRVVFLDISKAFDRVWHKGLLQKLYLFGIRGSLLDWFTDYLKDRCQRELINGQTSDWKDINAGVPQGSNLGPLLFLVFINDIVYVIRHCQIRLFADDTCLFITVDNREEAATLMNEDIHNIQTWADQWLINFSAPKTKTLLISNKGTPDDHPSLILQGHIIENVPNHKHLGIVLAHDLRWNAHINDIQVKCMKKINVMKKFKFKLDRKSLEIIYLSFIRPTMEYGDTLFAGTYDSDLCKLDKLQIDAMRIVTGATAKSNIALLYEDLNWPSLYERRKQHSLTLLYKIVNGQTPQYLQDLIPIRPNEQGRPNLRSDSNKLLSVPITRTESFRRSFIPNTIRTWNKLDKRIRDSPSVASFKEQFKTNKDNQTNLYGSGKRWPSIQHARLRIGCSKLNAHLCLNLHVIPSPHCRCGHHLEDPNHYFFVCPLFYAQRNTLMDTIALLSDNLTIDTLLYGDPHISYNNNLAIFEAVHSYIIDTHRFD